jgi:hypothetical protein
MDLKRKTSIIWNFFTPEDELKALCNFCKQKFSYKSSTTNLKAHITRKHPSIKLDVLPKEKHSTISQAASSECDTQVIQDQEQEPSLSPASPKPSTSTDSTEIHPPPVKKRRFHQTTISVPKKIGFSIVIQRVGTKLPEIFDLRYEYLFRRQFSRVSEANK